MTPQEVLAQSKAAFEQWGPTWDKWAELNGKLHREKFNNNSTQDLLFYGAGKTLLCCAYAPGFEKAMPTIVKHKSDAVDIACVDKCYGALCDAGIVPAVCCVADAGISVEKWLAPWKKYTKDTILLCCVTANHEYIKEWEGPVYFYVNKDNIKSEERYIEKSGVKEVIPASSNVGNSLVVFACQILGYDKYLLVGYDFSWGEDEKYYAYTDSDKRYWMGHAFAVDYAGRVVKTSSNLLFSCRWLSDYGKAMHNTGIEILNCSGQGLCDLPQSNLEREMMTAKIRKLTLEEKEQIFQKHLRTITVTKDNSQDLNKYLSTLPVQSVNINFVPKEVVEWSNTL